MNQVVVLNEEQFEDIIYRTVSQCLKEKNIGNLVEKPGDEGFYDRDELCELLHISYPSLWRIEKSGILKSQKVGRKNLYSKAEVNQLMKSGKLAKYNRNRK
jgi:hypothetical protein